MSYDIMGFPDTFDEYSRRYGFKDVEEHYTDGSELIPVFRVNQWLEHTAYKLSRKTMPEVINTLLESIKKEFSPIVGEYTTQEIWEIIDKHKIGGERMNNTLTLNSPLTKSDWDKICDVEFEKTEHIWYITPSGKRVDFIRSDILDKIRAEIKDWQTDIHDNEYDAENHDFVFEGIYEIIDKYKAESEGK